MHTITLAEDEIDDVLYLARANEEQELSQLLNQLAIRYHCQARDILEHSVDPQSGNTSLHYCAANGLDTLLQTLILTLAMEHNAPPGTSSAAGLINVKNAAGNTPLHWAAINGHLSAAKLLVAAGADVWARNGAGNLPVFEAEQAGKDEMVTFLLKEGGEAQGIEGAEEDQDSGEGAGDAKTNDVEDTAEELERSTLDD
ncbi:ankyrin repeat-containing protein [Elasticomyces elasticus]|nr:ankyrin repeat-containing protein [Elasticomyces elasticus]